MSESTGPDFESARALMQRFGPLVETIAQRYAEDGDDRDDLYQEIWMRILDRKHQYEGRGALGGWIQRLAHRFGRNWYKARKAHKERLERYEAQTLPMDLAGSLISNPEKLTDFKEFLQGLEQVFTSLPKRQSDVMILIHLQGYSIPEVAEILESKDSTIRSHHRHARKSLRRMLGDGNDDLP